jgi:hypothetical protein
MNEMRSNPKPDLPPLDILLRRHAEALRRAARLPSPESLLWRARLRRRLALSERGERLLSLYDRAALGVGVAVAVLAAAWHWDEVLALVPRFESPAAPESGVGAAIIAGAVLALAGLAMWAMTIWADD